MIHRVVIYKDKFRGFWLWECTHCDCLGYAKKWDNAFYWAFWHAKRSS